MSTTRRIIIAIIVIAVLSVAILFLESARRGTSLYRALHEGTEKFSGECVPVYSGKDLADKFCDKDAAALAKKSFRDRSENKLQEGWLLRDVILQSVKQETMKPETTVLVSSSSRGKNVEMAWKDIADEKNLVLLAPTKQGTLKLAAAMKGLDTRTKWVQDVDRIEILRP
jgi:hypothetical protein